MNYREAIHRAVNELTPVVGDSARIDAEVLLMHVLSLDRAGLYSRFDSSLTPPQEQLFLEYLGRRLTCEPVAYITGTREFFALPFHVDRRVLIPRPDTEILVERAIQLAPSLGNHLVIADVGVGSGAIAVSLAVNLPNARIYGIDQSEGALEVALKNVLLHHVSQQVTLLQGSLLEPLPEPADLIAANLPYVRRSDLPNLQPDVINFEPVLALDGGEDGLDKIRELLASIDGKLKPGGTILLEIGYDEGQAAIEIAKKAFPNATVTILKDLAGLDRVVAIRTEKS